MIKELAERRSPYIDVDVPQRLLKTLDFTILGLGALTITLGGRTRSRRAHRLLHT
jgi:hypothetical protein